MKSKSYKYSSSRIRHRHPNVFCELDAYLKAYLKLLKRIGQEPGK